MNSAPVATSPYATVHDATLPWLMLSPSSAFAGPCTYGPHACAWGLGKRAASTCMSFLELALSEAGAEIIMTHIGLAHGYARSLEMEVHSFGR